VYNINLAPSAAAKLHVFWSYVKLSVCSLLETVIIQILCLFLLNYHVYQYIVCGINISIFEVSIAFFYKITYSSNKGVTTHFKTELLFTGGC
jgi:hypothetical protein